jgi:hypothetical protein
MHLISIAPSDPGGGGAIILTNLPLFYVRIIKVPRLIDFGLLVPEKKIFKNFLCIFLSLLSPLEEGLSPSVKDT